MLLLCDASSYFWTHGPVVCFSLYDLWPWFRWAAVIALQHWFSLESLHCRRPGDHAEIQLAIKPSLSSYIMGLCQEVKTTVTLQKCLKRDRKSLTDCESVCRSKTLSLCLKRLLFSDGRQEDGHDGVALYSLYSGYSYGIFPASEVVQCSEDDSKEKMSRFAFVLQVYDYQNRSFQCFTHFICLYKHLQNRFTYHAPLTHWCIHLLNNKNLLILTTCTASYIHMTSKSKADFKLSTYEIININPQDFLTIYC